MKYIETDAQAGKRTLAVLLGARNTQRQYMLLLTLAYVAPPVLWIGFGRAPAVLLPLLTLPLAIQRIYSIYAATGTALNPLLAATTRLSLFYSLLLSIGLLF